MKNAYGFFLTRSPRSPHRSFSITALLFLVLFGTPGCVHDPTIGPIHVDAPLPKPGFARVYLYRVDPHHSYSTVEIQFDEQEPLHILDEEYLTLELAEGTHEIAFRLRRQFGWPSWTWRTQRIRAQAGQTIYFEIAVGVTERPTAAGRDLEIAGRAQGTAGETVSIQLKSESEAADRIRMTHLHVP